MMKEILFMKIFTEYIRRHTSVKKLTTFDSALHFSWNNSSKRLLKYS